MLSTPKNRAMVHGTATDPVSTIRQGRWWRVPAPICATSDGFRVCVHETSVGSGPLKQACKVLDKRDIRAAVGLAVVILGAWRFVQRRKRRNPGGDLGDEGHFATELGRTNYERTQEDVRRMLPLETATVSADGLERLWNSNELPANRVTSMEIDQLPRGPGDVDVHLPADKRISLDDELPGGVHELGGFAETRRLLELDLEDCAAERRAAEESLRQGFGRLLDGKGESPTSSAGKPLEASSPGMEDSPVAVLLAKAKATSEKVDRIHERLRRLSKGDGPPK